MLLAKNVKRGVTPGIALLSYALFLYALVFGIPHFRETSDNYKEQEASNQFFNKQMDLIYSQNKIPVYFNSFSEVFFSPKVFSVVDTERKVYFLDMFTFSYFEGYKKKHKEVYTKPNSLFSRIKDISENSELVFISTDEYNGIIENYLCHFQNRNLKFEKKDSVFKELNAYNIIIE